MTPDTDTELSAAQRAALLEQLAARLDEQYVFPETAGTLVQHLQDRVAAGTFDSLSSPHAFAQGVTAEMFAVTQDHHLRFWFDPEQASAAGDDEKHGEDLLKRHFQRARRANFGFASVERLVGNIGYLDLRELPPVEVAADVAVGALSFLANTQALIFDLRFNGGGSPEMVQFLISHLFDEWLRELSGIYSRPAKRYTDYWTLAELPGQRMPDVDVYVLTSGMTYSAAEAFAYDLQAMKRATIIGERSRGGAHLVDFQVIGGEFLFTLPVARAVNPLTGSNWEGIGVLPDVEVPQEEALQVAHQLALSRLLEQTSDEDERAFLRWEKDTLQAVLNPVLIDEKLLQQYAGHYGDKEIILEANALYCRQHTRLLLTPLTEDTFILTDDTRFRFVKDERGDVIEMVVLDREGNATPVPPHSHSD
jgi:hypothetical protein